MLGIILVLVPDPTMQLPSLQPNAKCCIQPYVMQPYPLPMHVMYRSWFPFQLVHMQCSQNCLSHNALNAHPCYGCYHTRQCQFWKSFSGYLCSKTITSRDLAATFWSTTANFILITTSTAIALVLPEYRINALHPKRTNRHGKPRFGQSTTCFDTFKDPVPRSALFYIIFSTKIWNVTVSHCPWKEPTSRRSQTSPPFPSQSSTPSQSYSPTTHLQHPSQLHH